MRFLILGCNGMAGHMISLYLSKVGYSVTGFARKAILPIETIIGDARDLASLNAIVSSGRFDYVVNCIGILNREADDNREAAVLLNAYLPHYLAEVTKGSETRIIHLSTDCVFSGDRGGYSECDFRDGATFYDRSKALGELEDNKNFTIRSSIIGPDVNPKGIGLLNWFFQSGESVAGYTNAIWTGQTTLQLAKTVEMVAKTKATGLVNMVPNQAISKYNLLSLINNAMHCKKDIIPDDSFRVDKSLVRTRFEFPYLIPDYVIMINELYDWMLNEKDWYPHYSFLGA